MSEGKVTTKEFIERAKGIHGNRYDYSNTEYVNAKTKVGIICPVHGEFWQLPHSHLSGSGCPLCDRIKRSSGDVFIENAIKVHGDRYDYSKVKYTNKETKVCIICPIHGEFWQRPHNHVSGKQGCPECGKKYAKEWRKYDFNALLKTSKERFGDRYSFPNIENEYENSHSKITIKCNKCGNVFTKIACDHITSSNGGCKHCYASMSKPEEEIGEFILKTLKDDSVISFNDREILKNNELDIYIKNKKIAIEYNGLFWHSDKDKNYHLMKTEMCDNLGIRLIQIFEDEYTFHKDAVLSKLKHILGCDYDLDKIYGRNCIIKEITFKESSEFLNKNHIQGMSKSTVYLGAFTDNVLCAVMSFTQQSENKWELTRFASDITKRAIGIGGKLFSYFLKHYNPTEVKSFADRRWTIDNENNLYHKLGFKLEKILGPDYRYFMNGEKKRLHKFGFRKKILTKKYNLSNELTEAQMAEKIGAKKIWDCGLFKYTWSKKNF